MELNITFTACGPMDIEPVNSDSANERVNRCSTSVHIYSAKMNINDVELFFQLLVLIGDSNWNIFNNHIWNFHSLQFFSENEILYGILVSWSSSLNSLSLE